MLLSFIIIGKNIEKTIDKCIKSVYSFIEVVNPTSSEIIYVDSMSKDRSVEIAKSYGVKVILLTGNVNAAIGRNKGAAISKGEVLFFIDGDMQLEHRNAKYFFSNGMPINNYVTGDLLNVLYSEENKVIGESFYYNNKLVNDQYSSITGGLFLIKRSLWEEIGGMNSKYKRSQDLDFGLRLARKGIKILRKKELLARHHNHEYMSTYRLKQIIKEKYFYYRGMLIRDHIFNRALYKIILRTDYTLLLFLFSCTLALSFSLQYLSFYFIGIIVRSLFTFRKRKARLYEAFFYFIIMDIQTLLGFMLFFPQKKVEATDCIL